MPKWRWQAPASTATVLPFVVTTATVMSALEGAALGHVLRTMKLALHNGAYRVKPEIYMAEMIASLHDMLGSM